MHLLAAYCVTDICELPPRCFYVTCCDGGLINLTSDQLFRGIPRIMLLKESKPQLFKLSSSLVLPAIMICSTVVVLFQLSELNE